MTLRPTLKSKRTRTFVLFFLLFLMLPFSFQCVKTPLDFKKPIAPQWSVPLNIQLIDRTFTFGQMIEKDPKFITDSTSHVEYRPSSIVNSPTAISLPELTPLSASVSNKLGLVPLNVPNVPDISVSFKDIFPPNDPPDTAISGVPTTIARSDDLINADSSYEYVVFENGLMSLTISNTFPFAISFPSGVRLVNADLGGEVAFFNFSTISAGGSDKQTAPVSGRQMNRKLKMNFTMVTSAFTNQIITATQKVTAHLVISGDLEGSSATLRSAMVELKSEYPVGSIPDSAVQLIDDSTKIKRAEFRYGRFIIKITNGIQTDIAVGFSLREFVSKQDSSIHFKLTEDGTLDTTGVVHALGEFKQTVSMVNYAIQSQKDTVIGGKEVRLSVPNVHFSINIRTLGKTQRKVLISKDDFVRLDITPIDNEFNNKTTYVLDKVIGKVKPTPVPINQTIDAAVGDLGNKFTADSINFDKVSITLKILSTGSFPTDLAMKIIGLDKNGVRRDSLIAREQGSLSDTLRINPGVEKKIVFDKSSTPPGGHGIDQFLSSFFSGGSGSMPQKFIVTGRALVDPPSYYQFPESTGTVKAGDSVYTSVEFKFPVRVGIISGTYKDTITISDTSANKIDKKSVAQIDNGKVIFTINNTFPFRLDVNSWLLQGLATDRSKPDPDTAHVLLWLPKDTVITADSARYYTRRFPSDTVGVTGTVIGLTPDDIDKINPASFVAVAIKMNTARDGDPPWGKPVEFKASNYVRLKAFVSVRYNVNFDKMK